MLAIVSGTEHFKHYLLGRKFTVESDHKALISVLNKQKPNKTYSSRLTRWKERLLIFDFDISYKQGSLMGITDLLSRNPDSDPEPEENFTEQFVICFLNSFNERKNSPFKRNYRTICVY